MMNQFKFTIIVSFLIFFFASESFAQYNPNYDNNTTSNVPYPNFSLGGGVTFGNYIKESAFGPEGRLGFNINALLNSSDLFGWTLNISRLSKEDGLQFTNWILGLGTNIYLNRSGTSFYFATGVNYFSTKIDGSLSFNGSDISFSDSEFDFNGGLGIEFLVDNISIFIDGKYLISTQIVIGKGGIRYNFY